MDVVSRFEILCDWWSERLKSPVVFSILVGITLVGLCAFHVDADPDLFHRLAMGKLLSERNSFPYTDPFAFTPKLVQWIDHEWLSGAVLYGLYSFGGEPALLLFRSIIYFLSIAISLRVLFLICPPSSTAAAWFLVCFVHGSFGWASVVRCQVFTYLFIPLIVLGILYAHLKNRWGLLYLTPFIMIPWCNLHGGFILGIILTLGFSCFLLISGGKWLRPLIVSILMIAATAINPYGFSAYWGYLTDALSMSRPTIPEWAPLWQQMDQFVATVFLTLVFLYGAILSLSKKAIVFFNQPEFRPSKTSLLLFGLIAFSAYGAFRHSRLLVFYMVLLAPLGAPFFIVVSQKCSSVLPGLSKKLNRVWSITLPFIAMISLSSILLQRREQLLSLDYNKYPTQAIAHLLDSSREGRLLLSFNVGSYALWKLYPRFLISMDGRYETVYPDSTVAAVEEAISSGDLKKVDALNPTDILITKNSSTPSILSELSEKWEVWYEDKEAVLLKPRT